LIEAGGDFVYRWALAALILTPFLLRPVWRQRRAIRPYLPQVLVLALLGMVLYQCLAYYAAATSSATSMGMIASLMPLLTLLLSSLFLREAPGLGTVCGGLLSLFGLLILIGQGHPMQLFENGVVPGDFLMLLATVAYALYGVLLSKWSLPIPSWQLLYLQTLVAVVLLVPGFVLAPSSPITAANLPLILFAGIAASILSQILWMRGVSPPGTEPRHHVHELVSGIYRHNRGGGTGRIAACLPRTGRRHYPVWGDSGADAESAGPQESGPLLITETGQHDRRQYDRQLHGLQERQETARYHYR